GGSHGGRGGDYSSYQSEKTYGNYQEPTTPGLGGRSGGSTLVTRGGGALKIVADELILNGSILANGSSDSGDGGGAGGSIWILVNTLRSESETASIRANGANGSVYGGGVGGGRVAVYYKQKIGLPDTSIMASGGSRGTSSSSTKYGAPGSVYLKQLSSSEPARLFFLGTGPHDQRMSIENILGEGAVTSETEVLVINQASWLLEKNYEFLDIDVLNNSTITTDVYGAPLLEAGATILKARNLRLDQTSLIDISGKGMLWNTESGAYTGGSHGGRGGDYTPAHQSGPTYGNSYEPVTSGQGGRTNGTGYTRGGGAIKIVAEEFLIDGKILANGPSYSGASGAAGGSIWLDIGILHSDNGTAEIRANGGNGSSYGGGGGGGRIAIYHELMSGIPEENITVNGGKKGSSNT